MASNISGQSSKTIPIKETTDNEENELLSSNLKNKNLNTKNTMMVYQKISKKVEFFL